MKLSNAAIGLAVGGLAVGGLAAAGLLVARRVTRARGETAQEPPSPDRLIGTPQSRLSAMEAADTLRGADDRPH